MDHIKVKQQEHAMKIVERMLKRQLQTQINLNKMRLAFMTGKVDDILIVQLQEEYQIKKK